MYNLFNKQRLSVIMVQPGAPFTNIIQLQFKHGLGIYIAFNCGIRLTHSKTLTVQPFGFGHG